MMRFSSYMNEWLYGQDGYYQRAVIGKAGDFYTSVSASKFFGGSIAWHILKLLEVQRLTLPLKIVEIGADKGHLIADVAEFLHSISTGVLQECEFTTIEPLAPLRSVQQKTFLDRVGQELKVCEKIEDLVLQKNQSVFVFANELFDSFACEVIDNSKMLYISNHHAIWQDVPPEIMAKAQKYKIDKGEIPTSLEEFIFSLVEVLNGGVKWEFLTFDYGQWEARNDINLRVYHNHQVENFLEISDRLGDFYQKSDITYDVNFSLLDGIFANLGVKRTFYGSQAKAMIEMGILELLEKFAQSVSYETYLREAGKIKPLISPMGLGERFHCISFSG